MVSVTKEAARRQVRRAERAYGAPVVHSKTQRMRFGSPKRTGRFLIVVIVITSDVLARFVTPMQSWRGPIANCDRQKID